MPATKPKRITRRRTAGFKLPPSVGVDRSTPFGNPFIAQASLIAISQGRLREDVLRERGLTLVPTVERAVARFERWIQEPQQAELLARAKRELRGKDLWCWCKPDAPCHADVLLGLVNS